MISQNFDRSSQKKPRLNDSYNILLPIFHEPSEDNKFNSISKDIDITLTSTFPKNLPGHLFSCWNGFAWAEEGGILSVKSINLFALFFENAPVWILGLFPIKIDKIHIPQFTSFSELLYHIQSKRIGSRFYNNYVTLIG